MGSNTSREIPLLGFAHPIEGNIFQVPKTHLGMGRIRGHRREEMAKLALSCVFFVEFMGNRPFFV